MKAKRIIVNDFKNSRKVLQTFKDVSIYTSCEKAIWDFETSLTISSKDELTFIERFYNVRFSLIAKEDICFVGFTNEHKKVLITCKM